MKTNHRSSRDCRRGGRSTGCCSQPPRPRDLDVLPAPRASYKTEGFPSMRHHSAERFESVCNMIRTVKHFCVFVSLALLVALTSAEYDTRESELNSGRVPNDATLMCSGTSCAKRSRISGLSGSMWFGPRLGRRRRSEEDKLDLDNEETNAIADVINGAPWALVSLPGGKRHAMQVFTPRLGRESGEDYTYGGAFAGNQDGSQDDVDQRSPLFAPRLGRRLPFNPSPRLGRELRALFQKL